ncbi:MAG: hypothetical protein ACI32O_02740 [Enterococcus sp.]
MPRNGSKSNSTSDYRKTIGKNHNKTHDPRIAGNTQEILNDIADLYQQPRRTTTSFRDTLVKYLYYSHFLLVNASEEARENRTLSHNPRNHTAAGRSSSNETELGFLSNNQTAVKVSNRGIDFLHNQTAIGQSSSNKTGIDFFSNSQAAVGSFNRRKPKNRKKPKKGKNIVNSTSLMRNVESKLQNETYVTSDSKFSHKPIAWKSSVTEEYTESIESINPRRRQGTTPQYDGESIGNQVDEMQKLKESGSGQTYKIYEGADISNLKARSRSIPEKAQQQTGEKYPASEAGQISANEQDDILSFLFANDKTSNSYTEPEVIDGHSEIVNPGETNHLDQELSGQQPSPETDKQAMSSDKPLSNNPTDEIQKRYAEQAKQTESYINSMKDIKKSFSEHTTKISRISSEGRMDHSISDEITNRNTNNDLIYNDLEQKGRKQQPSSETDKQATLNDKALSDSQTHEALKLKEKERLSEIAEDLRNMMIRRDLNESALIRNSEGPQLKSDIPKEETKIQAEEIVTSKEQKLQDDKPLSTNRSDEMLKFKENMRQSNIGESIINQWEQVINLMELKYQQMRVNGEVSMPPTEILDEAIREVAEARNAHDFSQKNPSDQQLPNEQDIQRLWQEGGMEYFDKLMGKWQQFKDLLVLKVKDMINGDRSMSPKEIFDEAIKEVTGIGNTKDLSQNGHEQRQSSGTVEGTTLNDKASSNDPMDEMLKQYESYTNPIKEMLDAKVLFPKHTIKFLQNSSETGMLHQITSPTESYLDLKQKRSEQQQGSVVHLPKEAILWNKVTELGSVQQSDAEFLKKQRLEILENRRSVFEQRNKLAEQELTPFDAEFLNKLMVEILNNKASISVQTTEEPLMQPFEENSYLLEHESNTGTNTQIPSRTDRMYQQDRVLRRPEEAKLWDNPAERELARSKAELFKKQMLETLNNKKSAPVQTSEEPLMQPFKENSSLSEGTSTMDKEAVTKVPYFEDPQVRYQKLSAQLQPTEDRQRNNEGTSTSIKEAITRVPYPEEPQVGYQKLSAQPQPSELDIQRNKEVFDNLTGKCQQLIDLVIYKDQQVENGELSMTPKEILVESIREVAGTKETRSLDQIRREQQEPRETDAQWLRKENNKELFDKIVAECKKLIDAAVYKGQQVENENQSMSAENILREAIKEVAGTRNASDLSQNGHEQHRSSETDKVTTVDDKPLIDKPKIFNIRKSVEKSKISLGNRTEEMLDLDTTILEHEPNTGTNTQIPSQMDRMYQQDRVLRRPEEAKLWDKLEERELARSKAELFKERMLETLNNKKSVPVQITKEPLIQTFKEPSSRSLNEGTNTTGKDPAVTRVSSPETDKQDTVNDKPLSNNRSDEMLKFKENMRQSNIGEYLINQWEQVINLMELKYQQMRVNGEVSMPPTEILDEAIREVAEARNAHDFSQKNPSDQQLPNEQDIQRLWQEGGMEYFDKLMGKWQQFKDLLVLKVKDMINGDRSMSPKEIFDEAIKEVVGTGNTKDLSQNSYHHPVQQWQKKTEMAKQTADGYKKQPTFNERISGVIKQLPQKSTDLSKGYVYNTGTDSVEMKSISNLIKQSQAVSKSINSANQQFNQSRSDVDQIFAK